MTRTRLALAALLATAGLAVAGCGGSDSNDSASSDTTTAASSGGGSTLTGTVGPGFDISMSGTDGVKPGTYTLTVDDKASSHNFHLTGPGGVDVMTDVGGTGEKTFTITLQKGQYHFQCDPHASSMNGDFTVG